MSLKSLGGGIYADDAMDDGYVVCAGADALNDLVMTYATWRVLVHVGAFAKVAERLNYAAKGTYLIPRGLLEADVAVEVRMGLSLVDAEPSAHCLYPPCGQDAVVVRDGFPLCEIHSALMADVDELVAV